MRNRIAESSKSRMNRAIARRSSPTVVTQEPACHAGGHGFESVAPVSPNCGGSLNQVSPQPEVGCLTWSHNRVRSWLRHGRAAAARRAGGALATNGLIRDGTELERGTRLLEIGCGVGAVLAVLGQEFPDVRLVGVDIEQKQLEFARGHLQRAGVDATLVEADALALPFGEQSFDHVWMMWFLEHIGDPPAALREARRVLVAGGRITAIEVDYSTCRAEPSTPAIDTLFRAMVHGMAASGWSDAGTRLAGWLAEAGFRE